MLKVRGKLIVITLTFKRPTLIQQYHLWMNVAPDLNNHIRSIDLFSSMIIKKIDQKFVRVIGLSSDSHWIVII